MAFYHILKLGLWNFWSILESSPWLLLVCSGSQSSSPQVPVFRSGLWAGQSGASRCSLSDCPCRCGCSIQVTTSSSKWTRYCSNSGLESKTQPTTTCFTAARLLDSELTAFTILNQRNHPIFDSDAYDATCGRTEIRFINTCLCPKNIYQCETYIKVYIYSHI